MTIMKTKEHYPSYFISQNDLELWQLHRPCKDFLKQKKIHRTVSMDCSVLYVCRAMGFALRCVLTLTSDWTL